MDDNSSVAQWLEHADRYSNVLTSEHEEAVQVVTDEIQQQMGDQQEEIQDEVTRLGAESIKNIAERLQTNNERSHETENEDNERQPHKA